MYVRLLNKSLFLYSRITLNFFQAAFHETDGPEGEAWISYSDISGLRFANLLVLDIRTGTQFSVSQKDTGLFDNVSRVFWHIQPSHHQTT